MTDATFDSDRWSALVDEVAEVWWGAKDCPEDLREVVDAHLRRAVALDRGIGDPTFDLQSDEYVPRGPYAGQAAELRSIEAGYHLRARCDERI